MWLRSLWQRLVTWFGVRLGLLRGRWRRGSVEVPSARAWWFGPARWSYALYSPAGLADDEPAPLIVLLHGCRQRALGFAYAAGFTRAADRQRFRLLCPEQRKAANPYRCWNWFHPRAQAGSGELDVVLAMVDLVEAQVSTHAVGAVGLSAGGGLAALLAFHHPQRFAAVAVVGAPPLLGRVNLQDPRDVMREGLRLTPTIAATLLPGCAPLFVLHGAEDEVVTPRCAEQLVEQARHVIRRDAKALVDDGDELRDGSTLRLRRRFVPCLGHRWPGGRSGHPYVEPGGPSLTDETLAFMREAGPLRPPAPPAAGAAA